MKQEIYQIQKYEHLRKENKREPMPLIITGVFEDNREHQTHPHLDINSEDIIGF